MAKVGIGVIGLGRMGQVYATHVARHIDTAALVAAADPGQDAINWLEANHSGVKVYRDYHDLLADPSIEAVIVASPTSTHRDVVIAAAQAGKAIFCEKPTSLLLTTTDEMVAATDKAGVMFQVGFMRRFDKGYAEAKRQIEADVIGQPVTIHCISRDPYRTSLEYANPEKSGGLILDMGIHDIDIARWLMGDDVERVYAEADALVYPELRDVNDVDNAIITLRFSNKGLGDIAISRTAIYGYDIQCEIVGAKGTIQVGYLRETPVLTLTKAGVLHDVVPHFPQRFGQAYTTQIEAFVQCLTTNTPPSVTAADARAALQTAIAATTSYHEQRPVKVAEVTG